MFGDETRFGTGSRHSRQHGAWCGWGPDGPGHHHGFGPGFRRHMGFFGPPWASGRRARRGDVRVGVLRVVAERPLHGYDIIRELEERSGGLWRPSPGSIYPTLQLLEDEGLVTSEERDGRRVFSITQAGREELEARMGEAAPWEFAKEPEEIASLREALFPLGAAAMQIASTASTEQIKRAAEVLADARRKLYAILSE